MKNNKENKKENMDLKKMSIIAGVAVVVLIVVLVASILLSKATESNQIKKDIEVELESVKVADTAAPKAVMAQRYIFTNDVAKLTDLTSMIKEVNDASDYTLKLIRFEKKEALKVLNELELKNLTAASDSFVSEEDALKVGTEELPTEAGIYRSVLKIEDTEGNASYEEVFVILDTIGALINDVPDQIVEVEKENLSAAPTLDETLYKGVDNVDGELSFSELTTELTVRDEAKHEWIVKVSYSDRAGNKSSGEFIITVVEKTASGNGGGNSGSGSKPQNNQNSGDKTNTQNKNPGMMYDPADTNKDGVVDVDEQMGYITPEKQACIDAGYGVVVEMDGGKWYAVLTHGDGKVNGKSGWEILTEYLIAKDLEAGTGGGCWINTENDWYWWIAEDIHELIGPDDEDYWEW